VPIPAIFYARRRESQVKPTNQVGPFYHMTFQNGGKQRFWVVDRGEMEQI